MDDVVTGKAVEWLSRKHDKPFCLFLWFKAPHRPWQRAPRHQELFKDVTIPEPITWGDDLKGKPKAFVEADNRIGNFTDVRSLDSFLKDYYSTLTAVDENVGRVFKALERTRALDNTVIMYTSDNGFFAGEWRMFDKRLMHEPSIKVPMLIRCPRLVKAGSISDRMVLNIDIAPTVLELAGVAVPKWMHGRSMVQLMKGRSSGWRKDWLYEYFEYPAEHNVRKHRGVRTEQYKLIHYYEAPEEFELYDLRKDPQERENLYGNPRYAQLARRLLGRIEELRRQTGDK
jgi:arylsulfatase A-like enzyme